MTTNRMKLVGEIRKWFEEDRDDLLREMLQLFAQVLMSAEVDQLCGAEQGARSPERVNHRNGYRERRWDTRVGTIDLRIPKLRHGSFFPHSLLEPRRRSERALTNVIAEAYVAGVSTRRVEHLVEALGIDGISKSQVSEIAKSLDAVVDDFRNRSLADREYPFVWLDALTIKTREGGRVVNVAVAIATGVTTDGQREILGLATFTSEDEAAWLGFLRSLVERGLTGVKLVISDAHQGLVAAIESTMIGASWQRCRTHFMTNLLSQVPKSTQGLVASLVRSIFAQPDAATVWDQHAAVVKQLAKRFPEAAQLLEDAAHDVLAFTAFPKTIWRQIWSNNPLERLNKEIRRRTNVVGIFPNRNSVIRLVGAVLCEQNDEWSVGRRYMGLSTLAAVPQLADLPPSLTGKEVALEPVAAQA